jgi:hypothetical protein
LDLYTISIRNRPVLTMSVDANDPLPDTFATEPEMLKALREAQALIDEMKARTPNLTEIAAMREIDEALDTWLGDDLRSLKTEGHPLWKGDRNEITVREARVDEAESWHTSRRNAINEGELEAGEESWLIFLVPVGE